jgi:hypothetical protein
MLLTLSGKVPFQCVLASEALAARRAVHGVPAQMLSRLQVLHERPCFNRRLLRPTPSPGASHFPALRDAMSIVQVLPQGALRGAHRLSACIPLTRDWWARRGGLLLRPMNQIFDVLGDVSMAVRAGRRAAHGPDAKAG